MRWTFQRPLRTILTFLYIFSWIQCIADLLSSVAANHFVKLRYCCLLLLAILQQGVVIFYYWWPFGWFIGTYCHLYLWLYCYSGLLSPVVGSHIATGTYGLLMAVALTCGPIAICLWLPYNSGDILSSAVGSHIAYTMPQDIYHTCTRLWCVSFVVVILFFLADCSSTDIFGVLLLKLYGCFSAHGDILKDMAKCSQFTDDEMEVCVHQSMPKTTTGNLLIITGVSPIYI